MKMTFEEAVALFDDADTFTQYGVLPSNSPLRKKTEEFFGCALASHMLITTHVVYQTIAKRYVEIIRKGK